jgi:hypothetical protein
MPAIRAALGRRVPAVNLDQVPPIPRSFIFQLRHELTPTDIADSFAQFVIFDHVFDCQALNADRLVFTDQAGGEFVQEITAAISYLGMDTCHLLGGFSTVLGPFFLFCVMSLSLGQFLFVFAEKRGITHFLTSGKDYEVFESQINPNGLLDWFKGCHILFDQDTHKVAISSIFRDGDGTRFAAFGQRTGPHDVQGVGHFGKRQLFAIPAKSRICRGCTLLVALLFERGVLAFALKEVHERFIKMSQRLLQGDAGNRGEPRGFFLFFELCQGSAQVIVVQAFALLVVGVSTQAQPPIVHVAPTPKGVGQQVLLFVRWVQSILVGSFLFHVLHSNRYIVIRQADAALPTPQTRNALVSPCLKDKGFYGRPR